jgi:ubiquinone/menaquinone biosynthesis C-methylase UbiE
LSTSEQDELTSRYVLESDRRVEEFVIPLPPVWWSRPYEYAWAAEFAEREHCVLDAACGISHPFKFFLARACKEVHACDLDARIMDTSAILKDVADDSGPHDVSSELKKMTRVRADITKLPYSDETFDRVFCISTVEHLTDEDAGRALSEFRRVLKRGGLAVITFDVPSKSVSTFVSLVKQSGLSWAGPFYMEEPEGVLRTQMYGGLSCFRVVLEKQ